MPDIDESSLNYQFGEIKQMLRDQNRSHAELKKQVNSIDTRVTTINTHSASRDAEMQSIKQQVTAIKNETQEQTCMMDKVRNDVAVLSGNRKAFLLWGSGALFVLGIIGKVLFAGFDFLFNRR